MSSQPNRKILDKLLWSTDIRREHRDLMNTRTASRFVQGIRDHSDPMEVLFQLDKRDPHLLRTIFTLDSSSDFMNSVVMPFLGWLGQDNLSIGTSCYKQQLVCNELARAPGLLEALLEALKCDEISDEMALVWFLERLLLDDGEEGAAARSSDGTHSALVDRLTRSMAAPVKTQAEKLLKILTDPGAMAKRIAEIATTGVASTGGISLEAVQESLPGGRHSNDHVDFRSITIVPSVDEVLCEKIPFLPTERDADVSHLDRQFRLLRHDLVASVVDALTPLKSLRTGAGKSKGPGNAKGGGGGGGGRPLLVLEQAKRGAIVADNGGRAAAVLIHFAWPPTHPISHMKSAQKQKDYLQQAKGGRGGGGGGGGGGAGRNLLKRDSLVILTDKSLKPLLFASITIRDEDRLVGGDWGGNGGRGRGAGRGGSFRGGRGTSGGNRSGRGRGGRGGVGWNGGGSWREWQESRPAVGVSFFCRQDLEAALLLSRDDSWGCLVPLSVGVFAYESVLKKLQTMADVPMGNLLVDWPAAHRAFLGSENGQQASLWQSVKGLWQSMENQASSAAPSPPETPQPPLYEGLQAEAMEQLAERFAPTPEGLKSRTSLVVSPPLPGVTLPAGCQFDISQRVAVAQVLRQRVSLVQGPPGTGKTFLGVFLAQTILSSMAEKILCVCYTNHALDSLLEDMLNKGITSMVRIGGGSKNPKLDAYQLRSRQAVGFDRVQNRRYAHLKGALEESQEKIDTIQRATRLNSRPDKMEVVAWLEDEDPEAFRELQMPEGLGGAGHTVVGKRGRALTGASIVQMWLDGNQKPSALLRQPANATRSSSSGNSNNHQTRAPPTSGIWAMDRNARKAAWDTWEAAIKAEAAKRVARKVMTHDMLSRELSELERQKDLQRVRGARVVGCTTTGAAIHHALLAEARCGVVLVEEAAEVLEAHVLTALEESTKHLIMIGDHKQLRPKVEQYSLRVESGRGFDLNVSLFERLVKSGYPHTTLELQHRMPPEVSALVRGLTYPGLRDGPGTANRPPIRGVRDRVCFVAHRNKEETASSMRQRQDDGVSASKVNGYEVRMVDKTVKYLLLQGYEPDQLVVLTPYLAQLREIRDKIDGALSSQDASDLAAAVKLGNGDTDAGGSPGNGDGGSSGGKGKSGGGHKGSGGGKGGGGGGDGGSGGAPSVSRKSVRVATVDNYQGEESDIVIVSFVRSNDGGQMGFVGDPNRLNVAISRARHGMIMFGDIDFFTSDSIRNKSGQRLWLGFLSLLEAGGHVYRDGLPVACETHKTRADMSTPEAFDELAPDGGCRVICGAKLTCDGRHPCPRRCHPGDDRNHENASCTVEVEDTCFKGHKSKRRCSKDPAGLPCRPCEREAAAVKREVERHAEAKAARERDREAATARLAGARRNAALEREKLAHERELMSLERETQRAEIDAERTRLSQKGAHASLEGARATAAAAASTAPAAPSAAPAAAPAADAKRGRKVKATAATTVNDKGEDNIRETATAAACGASSSVQIFGAKAGNRNHGVITPTTPKGSTLLLIAEAAGRGDARGITDALQAVPSGKGREQTCHALAVALGDSAYDWFARGSGGEPSPVGPPTQRTVQALGMVASGEWVKARAILAAIVKDTTAKKEGVNDSSKPPFGGNTKQVDPAAVYALALCDHQIAGGSGGTGSAAANKQLDELAAVELALWPGPPDSRPPPDARAFPLGALVRAHLLAAAVLPPSPQQERSDGVGGTASSSPTQDPKARACSLAVAFLRAPAHALRVGKVDSRAWFAAAEALVKENGGSLARELWGPGGGSGDDSVEYGRPAGGGGDDDDDDEDVIKAEWKKLQTKWGVSSEGMDLLLEMSGLDAIKADFLRVAKLTIINMERGFDPASGSFNIRLEGNPGTGKTTVARLYYRLLKDLRVFAAAESRAQDAKITAEAEAKKNADAAEKARQDAERRAFQSVGLPYTQSAARAGAGTSTPTATSASARLAGSTAATAGFVETTGADLADKGVRGLKDMLKKIREAGGGVLFVDEAYTLEPQGSGGGKQVLNFLLAEIENRRGELVVAFAGYAKNMETLFEFNEGLPSRFPKILRFADYSDALLLDIFKGLMAKKQGLGTLHFAAAGPIEGAGVGQGEGDQEWWAKVAIARLGRRRGAPGFGNARAVRVLFDEVMERQADRLSSCGGGSGDNLNPYELQKSDLLGKSVDSLDESEDWRTLRDMIGLTTVKKAVLALAEVVKTNRMLEEVGKPPRDIALNRCMLGNPGTGKTTVARLFAGILADLGLLSKGEVVLKTASDFVGSVLGESESKTRAILKASEGCVLVIDEAYSLSAVSGVGSGGSGDPYRTAVTDTLVEQVQNVPGEDRCVLLLGYPEQMKAFMRNTNPGLARRFALENAFKFEDYTDEELLKILRGKLRREQMEAGVEALMAAASVLAKKRATASHFGNGGDVATLLSEAKLRKENRRKDDSMESRLDPELLPQDFDPEYGVGPADGATLEKDLFGDLIGCGDIKLQLKRTRAAFILAERLGRDPREAMNMNFRFTGAPGTGKTTVAQRVGRMFKQLKVIHSDEVLSCSPSDMTTGFVGQAAKKTKEIMDKAIGKVLFIDEAYGLNPNHGGSGASFMQEAVDQLVQCMTDDKYKGKMVVIVAGYVHDIDELMESNPGLASRFPETLHFPNFGVDDCCHLFESVLKRGYSTELAPGAAEVLRELLPPIVEAPRFGNGRTITDLAKNVFTEIGMRIGDNGGGGGGGGGGSGDHDDETASVEDIRRSTAAILKQMSKVSGGANNANVSAAAAATAASPGAAFSTESLKAREAPKATIQTSKMLSAEKVAGTKRTAEERDGDPYDNEPKENPFLSVEDLNLLREACEIAGIDLDSPDIELETNEPLRRDFLLSRAEGGLGFSSQQTQAFIRKVVADRAALSRLVQEGADTAAKLAANEADADRALAEAEEAAAKEGGSENDEVLAMLRRAKEELERKLASEAASQAALQRMGVCPAGFKWNRLGSGWRCAGGSHYVAGSAVAAEILRGKESSGI